MPKAVKAAVTTPARPPLTLRERNRRQTHEHLLDVAAKLFARDGFGETTIDDIAAAGGTSRATVYAYFPTKDEILATMAVEMFDRTNDLYRLFDSLPDWRETTLRAWLEAVADAWDENRARTTAVVRHGAARSTALDQVHDRFIETLTARRERWAQFPPSETRVRAMLLITTVQSFFGAWYVNGWNVDRDLALDLLAQNCFATLHPVRSDH